LAKELFLEQQTRNIMHFR